MATKDELREIADKLDSVKDLYHGLDKKVDTTLAKLETHYEQDCKNLEMITASLGLVNDRLGEYNSSLQLHIQGVQEAQENNRILREELKVYKEEANKRLDKAEAPIKWLKTTQTVAMWITAIGAAAAALMAAAHWIR